MDEQSRSWQSRARLAPSLSKDQTQQTIAANRHSTRAESFDRDHVPTLDWLESVTSGPGRSFAIDPIRTESPVPARGDRRFLNLLDMLDPRGVTDRNPSISPQILRTLFGKDPLQRLGPDSREERTAWLLGLGKYAPRSDTGSFVKSYTPSPSEDRAFYLRKALGRRAGGNANALIDLVDPLTPILDFRHRRKQRIPMGLEDLLLAAGIVPSAMKVVTKGGKKLIKVGGGASLDNITPWEARRIQNAANRTKQEITLVGSRARGTANLTSDWDYIMNGKSSKRHSARSSVPRGTSGGELNGLIRDSGIDIFQGYHRNPKGPEQLIPTKPHIIFHPEE